MNISKPKRKFVDNNLVIDSWKSIEGYYNELIQRNINSKEEFLVWLRDQSELEAILEEDAAWRYIKMTIDTKDEDLSAAYTFFVKQIQPQIAPLEDQLNRKIHESAFIDELSNDPAFNILFRGIKKALELYREENVSLQSEVAEESQKFGAISAAQSIEYAGERFTMQKAALFLKETEETIRKEVFEKMASRRLEDVDKLDSLFNTLLSKRHEIAINAGFKNFRDYKMEAMGRFDYTVTDCENFHQSVKTIIVPLVRKIQQQRLKKLGKNAFKPWDTEVDPEGEAPLKPFKTGKELLEGTVNMFHRIDPYFGDCLETMAAMNHLDLESKSGKSPGGYNYPLYEIGVPFIFMNAVGSHRDLVTMVHDGGHAIHSFLSRDLELTGFKNLPSEVAELASMSMELLSMDEWSEFYTDSRQLNRAILEQLETILKLLPWIAQVDEFQHWLYVNHEHTIAQRNSKWLKLSESYGTGLTDWSNYEDVLSTSWQRQLHIFEVPFYYIEYGIAQLGAIGIWKNSLDNKQKAIEAYKSALQLAYTRTIPEIYESADIKFDFTENHISELAAFIENKLAELESE